MARNDIQVGVTGFGQRDNESFDVLFNDGSNRTRQPGPAPDRARWSPRYVEDTFKPTQTGCSSPAVYGRRISPARSPKMPPVRGWALTVRLPRLDWILRGFWGKYYQAPPLTTLSGPLLQYAQNNNLGFLPLHGERDEE